MRFAETAWLAGVWVLPVGLLVLGVALWRGRAALARLFDARMRRPMTRGATLWRPLVKGSLVLLATSLVSVALARPQWGAEPERIERRGRDVCFVIDVSRSMLAEDLAPNRLERTKLWVSDAMEMVRGDRVGLVAFAGSAVVKCPLTHDYGFFRLALDELRPDSVSRGGTLIGDAIRRTMSEVFEVRPEGEEGGAVPTEARYRDIILITDGGDHGSFPVEAAAAAGEAGIRIIAIGIGSEDEGVPIPITDERGRTRYLEYQGERVLSRLDAETLGRMAVASRNGRYFNVATGEIDLGEVYRQLVRQDEQQRFEEAGGTRLRERFQVFLGIALGLLLLEPLIRERGRGV